MQRNRIQLQIKKIHNSITGTMLLLLAVIALILLPCVVISTYANSLITNKIRTENNNFFYAAYSSLDNAIRSATSHASALVQANASDYYALLNTSKSTGSDYTLASWHLYNALRNSQFNSDYFTQSFLYFPSSGLIITSSGSYKDDIFFDKKYIFESYPEGYFAELAKNRFSSVLCPLTSVFTTGVDGQRALFSEAVIPIAIHPAGSSASDALLVLFMEEKQLNSAFYLLNPNQSCYIYLMDTNTGKILNQPAPKDYSTLLSLEQYDYQGRRGTFLEKPDQNTCHISWQTSSVSKLRYILVEPQLLITHQLHAFLFRTVVIICFTVLLLILLYRFLLGWFQKSYSSILHRLSQATSAGKRSASAQNRISIAALKDAVELLCVQYESNQPQLITSFLAKLMQGNAEDEEIASFCTRFGLFSLNDCFCLLIFRTYFPDSWEETASSSRREILSGLEKSLEEYGYVISFYTRGDLVLFLTASVSDGIDQRLQALLSDWDALASPLPTFLCARSLYYYNIHDTYRYYHQVLTLLDHHGIRTPKQIYTMEDLMEASSCQVSPEDRKKIQLLSRHSATECISFVENLLTLWKSQNCSLCQYRAAVLELLFLLQQILYELAVPISYVFSDQNTGLIACTEQLLTPEALDLFCLNAYRQLLVVRSPESTDLNHAEKTLLDYIHEHLADINLTALSEATGMNQNYLSQYFKKHFGVTFLDYVTRKKIDQAKELLVNSSLTCKSIGEKLGYYDQNVFIRNFKKLEAVTPNEYRRSHKN